MRSSTAHSGPKRTWLNRNVAGMAVTSFLSDAGHEMVTAVLPGFLGAIGIAASALGWIEGVSDAASSFVKLGAGWYSDRIGRRKGIVAVGYFLTGSALALFSLAASWPLLLAGRLASWLGRGIRSPLRDAMLSESVPAAARGKAFGLHRAGDTLGAVIGPLAAVGLLSFLPAVPAAAPFRTIFVLSVLPGMASVGTFVVFVREARRTGEHRLRFWRALNGLPAGYLRFLRGVGLFGMGDFSHTLLILAATTLLAPSRSPMEAARIAALLYALRNVVYAAASFPVGALGDRLDKQKLLGVGYGVGVLTAFGTAAFFAGEVSSATAWAVLFALAGVYIAMEDALEGAIPADLVPGKARGTAYGLIGTVNGIGDLIASVLVGSIWSSVSPAAAFASAGALMLLGTAQVVRNSGVWLQGPAGKTYCRRDVS